MLTNITLENFKAFQKLNNLKIKPVTILCGTNSCGKSSILQSILLMKQTLESKNPNQNLLLNGRFTKLGYFEDIIYQKNKENEVKFVLDFVDNNKIIDMYDSLNISHKYNFFSHVEISFKKSPNGNSKLNENNGYRISKINLNIDPIRNFTDQSVGNVLITHREDNNYNIIWENYEIDGKRSGEDNFKINFSNLFLFDLDSSANIRISEMLQKIAFSDLISMFSRLNRVLKDMYSKYTYLGPLRGEPEREYIYRDEVVEIGNKGENAAFLYLSEQNKSVENHFFYDKLNDNFEAINNLSLKEGLNKWFNLMQMGNFDGEIINKIIYLSLNASKFDETKVGIADVGFGVSQIFPILLEGLRMPIGATLLLEQPEIHLHPNLQMQMADYFIALALSGKRVIAETHSDHIVNRLVRRIVEDETHNLKDLIGIYFIKPSENGSIYEEITIDETKGITNWPDDFFDQTASESMKIMQAGLKKRKNQRNNINA
jgi:predicted ATPase